MAPIALQNADVNKLLFDFTDPGAVLGWTAIDDRVMGGVSQSRLRFDPTGHAVFEGTVSLERNGGFASVRSSPGQRGKPHAVALVVELCGGGKRFKLGLLTDDGVDGLNYQAAFVPAGTGWQTLRLPLSDFRASYRGREVANAVPLDPARIRQIGILIGDRQAGAFELGVRRIGLG